MNSVGDLVSSMTADILYPPSSPFFSHADSFIASPLSKVTPPILVLQETLAMWIASRRSDVHSMVLGGFLSGTKHKEFSLLL